MKPLPNFDITSLGTVDETLSYLENNIRWLSDGIDGAMDDDDVQQFIQNLDWIKRIYERAEVLARDDK
jgi:gamma-glutamyl:cysteine ligase YbdK (ATP-grasp superfamily)